MNNQINFLIALGAYENSTPNENKIGIINDMLSPHKNEELWLKTSMIQPFMDAVYEALDFLMEDVIEQAIDGTIFPKEGTNFTENFREIIYNVCEELELDISFDGYSYEEAKEITQNKSKFIEMVKKNKLEFSHLVYDEDERVCILTMEQAKKLALLSIQFDVYSYFAEF